MPPNLNRLDVLMVLIALIASIYLVGLVNERECTQTVNKITKRCELPIDGKQLRVRDEELLESKDLLDMENNWLTFRARFTIKDNKLSMEMVRLYSTKNDTSEWRMDPETDTSGGEWFTLKGRWVGKPVSFEFDQKDPEAIKDPEPTATKGESWFNNKVQWLGAKVLEQIDFDAVPERKVTGQDTTEEPALEAHLPKPKQDMTESMRTQGTAVSQDEHVNVTEMSDQSALQKLAVDALRPEAATEKEHTQGTAISQATAPRPQNQTGHNNFFAELSSNHSYATDAKELLSSQDISPNMTHLNEGRKATQDTDTPVAPRAGMVWRRPGDRLSRPKCPRFSEYNASNVIKNTSACPVTSDEASTSYQDPDADQQCPWIPVFNDDDNRDLKQSLDRDMGVSDSDCEWYSTNQVLIGATTVVTVTVTVATSYVMMGSPHYVWAQ